VIGYVAVAPRTTVAVVVADETATVGVCCGGVGSSSEHAVNSTNATARDDSREASRITVLIDSRAIPPISWIGISAAEVAAGGVPLPG
jgi:hypothetical protein